MALYFLSIFECVLQELSGIIADLPTFKTW